VVRENKEGFVKRVKGVHLLQFLHERKRICATKRREYMDDGFMHVCNLKDGNKSAHIRGMSQEINCCCCACWERKEAA
jgi:hypothetical protein